MNTLRFIFKCIFSGALSALAIALIYFIVSGKFNDPTAYILAMFCIILSTTPWIKSATNIAMGLLFLFLAIGLGFIAKLEFQGLVNHPQLCIGKGSGICDLANLFYNLGGNIGASAVYAWFALLFLWSGLLIIKYAHKKP